MFVIPDTLPVGPTLLHDLFEGVDGTALQAHSPNIGGPWVDLVAGLQIESDSLEAQSGVLRRSINTVGTGYGTLTVEAQFLTLANADSIYFGCGFSGATPGIFFEVQQTGSLVLTFINGPFTDTYALTWTPDLLLHSWEIVSVPGLVSFFQDSLLLHQFALGTIPPFGGDVTIVALVTNESDVQFQAIRFRGLP